MLNASLSHIPQEVYATMVSIKTGPHYLSNPPSLPKRPTRYLLRELHDLENAFTFAFEQLYIPIRWRAHLIRLLFRSSLEKDNFEVKLFCSS